jgi:hypothetical protein
MALEAAKSSPGFLLRTLSDGAQPFRYRGKVRTLLGYAASGGPEMNFAAPQPVTGFRYMGQHFSAELEFPDEAFADASVPRSFEKATHGGPEWGQGRERGWEYGSENGEASRSPSDRQQTGLTLSAFTPRDRAQSPLQEQPAGPATRPSVPTPRPRVDPTQLDPAAPDRRTGTTDLQSVDEGSILAAPVTGSAPESARISKQSLPVASKIHIPNAVPKKSGVNRAAPSPLSLSPGEPAPQQANPAQQRSAPPQRVEAPGSILVPGVRRNPLRDVPAPRASMPGLTLAEEPRSSPRVAPQPTRSPERPRRRAETLAAENRRVTQSQPDHEDPPPKPAPATEPAQAAAATVQAPPSAEAASPAFWERRHLNHLSLRMRR